MDFVKPPRWSKAEADWRLVVALRLQIETWLMTEMGQSRPNCAVCAMSGLPPLATGWRTSLEVRFVPIFLQKSFRGGERKFLEPLMRLARGDVRDHIASSKIDHGPP
jgi:hypothetical protein